MQSRLSSLHILLLYNLRTCSFHSSSLPCSLFHRKERGRRSHPCRECRPSNTIEAVHSLAFSLSIGFRLFTKSHLRHTELRLCRLPTTRHYVLEQGFAITRPLCFRFLLPLLRLRQKKEGAILCRVLRSYAILTHRSVWYLPF